MIQRFRDGSSDDFSLNQRLGTLVRATRLAHRLTQEALAERSRLSVDTVRRLERGRFSPTLITLSKLSRGLGLSLLTLISRLEGARPNLSDELQEYLAQRTDEEMRLAQRMLRALFEAETAEV